MGNALSFPLSFVCGSKSNERLSSIEGDISAIKDNHLSHLETDVAIMKNDILEIKMNVAILINRP